MERRESQCVEASRPAASHTSRPGPVVEEVLRGKTGRERWLSLMRHIREECPDASMYRVNIADGIIVSCESLQLWLWFEPLPDSGPSSEAAFDGNWQRLEAACGRIGTGRLAELHFSGGRPVFGKPTPQGRRFRLSTKN